MDFSEAFSAALGEQLGGSVDSTIFSDADVASSAIDGLTTLLGELSQTDIDLLDALATEGLDLSEATDPDGSPLDLGGGPLLQVAALTATPISTVAQAASSSYEVALAEQAGGGEARA